MDHATLLAEVSGFESLGPVIRWAIARTPPAEFVDVVIQDEFTHDVVVRVEPSVFLVFDTT
jgi:hypothetical protein